MKPFLLDSSFVIDLLNEIAAAEPGPALHWLKENPRAKLWIGPITLAEVLEGAEDPAAINTYLARYAWQGIHRAQAEQAASRQGKVAQRLGENDAWQAAIAQCMKGVILGHDRAFESLGAGYEDYRRAVPRRGTAVTWQPHRLIGIWLRVDDCMNHLLQFSRQIRLKWFESGVYLAVLDGDPGRNTEVAATDALP
jgi:predicted nucleic acid-binding protein